MNISLRRILVLTISILSLYACNRSSTLRVSSVIQDKSCSPPCWEQITPGKTARKEVKPFLEEISWVKKVSIKDAYTVSPGDSIKWMGLSTAADYSGRVFFNNDIVTLITISPNKGVIIFTDLITKLGDPENILVVNRRGEKDIISIFILYPSKGYGFLDYYEYSNVNPESVIEVKPDEDVKQVWYGEPIPFYEYLTQGQIERILENLIRQGIQKWNGFGKYPYAEN
ncbi:MAG: hypothetical protein PHQ40_05000 [Anaerolineaceae bacterium]|nr:hypothetical protein [Anaerolineaceae bacterium]